MKMTFSDFSIVILTFDRPDELVRTIRSVRPLAELGARVIVVDNGADSSIDQVLAGILPDILVIRSPENIGVGARNLGLRAAETAYAVTLDDDVRGLSASHLAALVRIFEERTGVGAVCFKVVREDDRDTVINWCHHRKVEEADSSFPTYEISEGAVALRMQAVRATHMYPESFFISHEGPALAVQLMNHGYEVIYSPEVVVTHAIAKAGRPGWRRYYFDTRNVFWLAAGYLPFRMGFATVFRGVGALLVYSLRDGFARFWAKGMWDGLTGSWEYFRSREAPTEWTKARLAEMRKRRPGFFYLAKRRLFRKGVQI